MGLERRGLKLHQSASQKLTALRITAQGGIDPSSLYLLYCPTRRLEGGVAFWRHRPEPSYRTSTARDVVAMATPVTLRRLSQEAAVLANVVRGSLGPHGGQVLLTRPTGEVLLSRDGRRVLEALNVESPTASLTGDGAKTFIILLSALLQGLEKLGKGNGIHPCENIQRKEEHKEKCFGLKQVSQFLMMIQTYVLDHIVTQNLKEHFLPILSVCDTEISRSTLESVLEAYFCGKVGNNRQKLLSQLSCNFYFKLTADKNRSEVLYLVDECFAELHTTVTGLPVSSSRILDGLVLHRDFAVFCPADGDKKVLLVTEPIQSALSDLGVEVVISADSQYQASEIWITKRTEAVIKHMKDNNIKILLSSVKQQKAVHYCAENSGISIVECLSQEEISFICRITGISPFRPSLDNIHSEITEVAIADFCQTLRLGARSYVHIGLKSTHALQLHCAVLCGPVHGITEQHACALHGAFKMLKQMFTAIHLTEHCDLKSQSQDLSQAAHNSQQCSAAEQHFVEEHTDMSKVPASDKLLRLCGIDTDEHSAVSTSVTSKEVAFPYMPFRMFSGVARSFVDLQHDARCRVLNESESNLVGLQKLPQKCTDQKEMLENNLCVSATVEENATCRHVPDQLQSSKHGCTRQVHGVPLMCNIQSNSSLKVGSVVPVGGIFEILLHYYLSYYAKQCQSPNISILCTLIADVLLNVPKTLCRTQKRNAFPQLYLKVTHAVRNTQHLLTDQKSLESVTCKYQLVVSVLHCAARLLSFDLIISIKRLPQKSEESDSEVEL
ncbi:Bardet-Biedl syndrome 10 protein isoform X2 [Hemicordylus capensis]|uniref:Bardet-Biedl syndrome 10 protein isoform X2 n=1 Tax=Hemicordylus capensis TaxID=884348 RepID=UPI002304870F|nr:Bardet-Biedl syndrome 10 protein isoform X2 [Hemicordylus capensis]